jgi:hypothetical protein
MNNDDNFGQYNCIAENIHGRMEAIVFVLSMCSLIPSFLFLFFCLEESIVLSTLKTTTQRKSHRHSKRLNSSRKYIRSTTSVYIERDIHIISSSYRLLWTSHRLLFLLFLLFLLKRIER